jgi:hypothetical protein
MMVMTSGVLLGRQNMFRPFQDCACLHLQNGLIHILVDDKVIIVVTLWILVLARRGRRMVSWRWRDGHRGTSGGHLGVYCIAARSGFCHALSSAFLEIGSRGTVPEVECLQQFVHLQKLAQRAS